MGIRKKTKMNNYDFIYGLGCNYVDYEAGIMYMIQPYKEDIEKGMKPKGIEMVDIKTNDRLGYIQDYVLRNKMEDAEIDPRYAPETPEEHRKNW